MKILISIVFAIFYFGANAQDSSIISINKKQFLQGDTILFNFNNQQYVKDNYKYLTLNVWLENIDSNKSWKFRYPIINGICNDSFIIDSSISNGRYALNFIVQKSFFYLNGHIGNYNVNQKEINYILYTKDDNSLIRSFLPDDNGFFRLKGLLYQDTATFVFTPSQKNIENTLLVEISSPLDSAFIADTIITQLIKIGNPKTEIATTKKAEEYIFKYDEFNAKTTLPDVVVTTKFKKKVEQFDEKYSSGLFKSANARIFDGIESDQITRYITFIEFLKGKVAGLQIIQNGSSYRLLWRGVSDFRGGSNVDIFIDEMKVDLSTFNFNSVSTNDIAMIKAVPPPAFLSGGGSAGAIIVYTKRGDYDIEAKGKYKFKVFGYNSPETIWKK